MTQKEQAQKELNEIKERAKALELIINEPEKPEFNAEEYLKDILNQCKGKVYKDKIVLSIGDQWIFEQDLNNKTLWCYYYKVWKIFETEKGLNHKQIQALIKDVVGTALNCKEFTPFFSQLLL